MSDTQPPRRDGITGLAGDVVSAFKTSPVLLLIVLLNMAFAGAASYFMTHLEVMRHEAMVTLLDRCLPAKLPTREP